MTTSIMTSEITIDEILSKNNKLDYTFNLSEFDIRLFGQIAKAGNDYKRLIMIGMYILKMRFEFAFIESFIVHHLLDGRFSGKPAKSVYHSRDDFLANMQAYPELRSKKNKGWLNDTIIKNERLVIDIYSSLDTIEHLLGLVLTGENVKGNIAQIQSICLDISQLEYSLNECLDEISSHHPFHPSDYVNAVNHYPNHILLIGEIIRKRDVTHLWQIYSSEIRTLIWKMKGFIYDGKRYKILARLLKKEVANLKLTSLDFLV